MLRKGLVIYEPKGRAGEYCDLAINLYRGCSHGCVYCYAPDAMFMNQEEFKNAVPRPDIIKKLQRDAPKAAADGATGNVLLCFTCDPYQLLDEINGLTRQAILILHSCGFNITILTKGAEGAVRDFDLYRQGDEFATTLTFMNHAKSWAWEPGAAPPADRIAVIKEAHRRGIKTWVSLEPVIEPTETLEIIRQTHTFVNLYKVGTLNNHPQAKKIDWPRFAREVKALLEDLGCDYYLKKDLRRYL